MKRTALLFVLLALLVGCKQPVKYIVVSNPSLEERTDELVQVPASPLQLSVATIGKYALFDEEGNAVPFEVVGPDSLPMAIRFQASVRGGMQRTFVWKKGRPLAPQQKVFARFVPERKDDFAWENEYAAYRMYGPALADEYPSNGIDLWLKSTDQLIVDSFYYRELQQGYSYHINWGKGLDCYKVAHTLGCGGTAPFVDDSLWVGDHFNTWRIIQQGALQTTFSLSYDNMEQIITVQAGSPFCRSQVIYKPVIGKDGLLRDTFLVAAGIYLHDTMDNVSYSAQGRWAAYAEEAVSDAGVPQGRNYAAVIMPEAEEVKIVDKTLISLAPYVAGDTLTYYFAGGWSKWHFPHDADWFSETAFCSEQLRHPLVVTIRNEKE